MKRIDQQGFLASLEELLGNTNTPRHIHSTDDIDAAVTNLTNSISHCATINKIKHRSESKPNRMNWWFDKLWGIRLQLKKQ